MTARELLKTLANVKDLDKEVVVFDNNSQTKIDGKLQCSQIYHNGVAEGNSILITVDSMEPSQCEEMLSGGFKKV